VKFGVARVNLSEYAGIAEASRTYLLDQTTTNAALTVTVRSTLKVCFWCCSNVILEIECLSLYLLSEGRSACPRFVCCSNGEIIHTGWQEGNLGFKIPESSKKFVSLEDEDELEGQTEGCSSWQLCVWGSLMLAT
jgi:hypothetical protein